MPFPYSILSKEMVFSLPFEDSTYRLKVVKLLICILTHPLLYNLSTCSKLFYILLAIKMFALCTVFVSCKKCTIIPITQSPL